MLNFRPYFYAAWIALGIGLLTSVPTAAQEKVSLSWRSLVESLPAKEPEDRGPGSNGGGRPTNSSCKISPGANQIIWRDRPLFVVRGNIVHIGVRAAGSNSVLWRGRITGFHSLPMNRAIYSGKPLQADKTYQWLVFFSESSPQPLSWTNFQVMPERDRTPITRDLQVLETRLKAQRATSEAIALERANYFATKGLWADTLQEIYAFDVPAEAISEEWRAVMEKVAKEACSQ